MEDKKHIRSLCKKQRDGIKNAWELSRKISALCVAMPEFADADTVLLYAAKGSEADLSSVFYEALAQKKTVGYPRCIDKEHMVFCKVYSENELEEGYFGIKEPSEKAPVCTFSRRTLCFVPALAYDRDGYRVGYGGGYYDRFLADFEGVTVGVTFEELVFEKLPRREFDIKTDYIITESRVRKTIES